MDDQSVYKFPEMGEGYWTAVTRYFHNKIAAVDTDKKVSNIIKYRCKNAVIGNKYDYYKYNYHFSLTRDSLIGDLLWLTLRLNRLVGTENCKIF